LETEIPLVYAISTGQVIMCSSAAGRQSTEIFRKTQHIDHKMLRVLLWMATVYSLAQKMTIVYMEITSINN